jgi:hypothetical protein
MAIAVGVVVSICIHGFRLSKRRPIWASPSRKVNCMEGHTRVRVLLFPMTLAVAIFSALPGCGGDSGDGPMQAPAKTPSQIQKEALAKNADLPPRPETKATVPRWVTKATKTAKAHE